MHTGGTYGSDSYLFMKLAIELQGASRGRSSHSSSASLQSTATGQETGDRLTSITRTASDPGSWLTPEGRRHRRLFVLRGTTHRLKSNCIGGSAVSAFPSNAETLDKSLARLVVGVFGPRC